MMDDLNRQKSQQILMMSEDDFMNFLDAFYVKVTQNHKTKQEWIPEPEAMKLLGIKSKTTLWKFRSEGRITFSKMGKIILYRRTSIKKFIESKEQKAFRHG